MTLVAHSLLSFFLSSSSSVPLYWSDIHDTISEEDASKFRKALKTIQGARAAAQGMRTAGIAVGATVAVASAAAMVLTLKAGAAVASY